MKLNPFSEGESPLDYSGKRAKRLSWIDPILSPPIDTESYFAEIKREKKTKTGRKFKKARFEILPGAAPGTAAFLDYEVYPDGSVYIHYIRTRSDERGKGHMRRLLDEFIQKFWTAPSIDFGNIQNQSVWKYYLEKKNDKNWSGPYLHGKSDGVRKNPSYYRKNLDIHEKWKNLEKVTVSIPGTDVSVEFEGLPEAALQVMEFFGDGFTPIWLKTPEAHWELNWMELEHRKSVIDNFFKIVVSSPVANRNEVLSHQERADLLAMAWILRFGSPIYYTVFEHFEIARYVITASVLQKYVKNPTDLPLAQMPQSECDCDLCRSMCNTPCLPTPAEAEALIDAGYAMKLMYDSYDVDWGTPEEAVVEVLSMASPGCEGRRAPDFFFGKIKGCVFHKDGLCEIHKTYKPLEAKIAHHSNADRKLRRKVVKTWNTPEGKRVIRKWTQITGF